MRAGKRERERERGVFLARLFCPGARERKENIIFERPGKSSLFARSWVLAF